MNLFFEDDLDLDRIMDSGQCFRWEKLGDQHYRIPHKDFVLVIRKTGEDCFSLDCSEEEFRAVWEPYFDFALDYRKIRGKIPKRKDPFLFAASEDGKGIRILRQDPWEMLITSIITQNRNIPAIRRSVDLLCRSAGKQIKGKDGTPFYAFPSPEAIAGLTEEDLKNCRLGYRCRYVHAAAAACADGTLDLAELGRADDAAAMKMLTSLFGVGEKVASCVMLFGLHRTDAFPVDVWMKRILDNEYPDGYPMKKYRPWNGIYQQYMFAYYRKLNSQSSAPG